MGLHPGAATCGDMLRYVCLEGGAHADAGGVHAGGAQDIENFRENIAQGYLPLPTDATYEGIIKDYYFDTAPR